MTTRILSLETGSAREPAIQLDKALMNLLDVRVDVVDQVVFALVDFSILNPESDAICLAYWKRRG